MKPKHLNEKVWAKYFYNCFQQAITTMADKPIRGYQEKQREGRFFLHQLMRLVEFPFSNQHT